MLCSACGVLNGVSAQAQILQNSTLEVQIKTTELVSIPCTRFVDPHRAERTRKDRITGEVVRLDQICLAVISHSICDIATALNQFNINGIAQHYFIARDGAIAHFVDEADRAWHAGVAFSSLLHERNPDSTKNGTNDVNSHSIGISLEGNGHVEAFTEQQYNTLVHLLKDLMMRTDIQTEGVVSLADVAMPPGRHVAPGVFVDWDGVRAALNDVV
jgi:N-acetyl-anhydromuramyl-L-alanine amidase AmpD